MLGTPHIQLETVASTNSEAKDRIRAHAAEGTVITARHQTAGRGRLDRQWLDDPDQSLLASYILYPERDAEDWGGLPLLSGLAVKRAIDRFLTRDVRLKWPNDVLIDGKKLCGILVESGRMGDTAYVILGIGINVRQRAFPGGLRTEPTSMYLESGVPFETGDILAALSGELTMLYEQWQRDGNAAVIPSWKTATDMLPSSIRLEQGDEIRMLRAVDVSPSGALVVENAEGEREEIFAGDVSVVPTERKDLP